MKFIPEYNLQLGHKIGQKVERIIQQKKKQN